MESEQISIREATLEDMPVLLKLEQEVVKAERPFDPLLNPTNVKYYDLDELIQSELSIVFVATHFENIISSGYAKILEAKDYFKIDKYAYLGFMYVSPNHRRKGLNGFIIHSLLEWIKSKNIQEVRLDVYAQNDPAIKAYKKYNFEERMIEMRLDLSKQPLK